MKVIGSNSPTANHSKTCRFLPEVNSICHDTDEVGKMLHNRLMALEAFKVCQEDSGGDWLPGDRCIISLFV